MATGDTFDRTAHCRAIASLGGQAVVEKYGPEYMSDLGKKGLRAMVNKYFEGDRKKALEWLQRKGYWSQVKDTPYAKRFFNPGPFPGASVTIGD